MNKFNIILNGKILSGFQQTDAEEALTRIFNIPLTQAKGLLSGKKVALNQVYSAVDAIELQSKLNASGIDAVAKKIQEKTEFIPLEAETGEVQFNTSISMPELNADDYKPLKELLMTCPACGHQQKPSERCGNCGIDFDAYNSGEMDQTTKQRATINQWEQFEDNVTIEKQVKYLLSQFIGVKRKQYLDVFKKFDNGGIKPKFIPSWNLSALALPFWALYRRLWLIALIGTITWLLIPLTLVILSYYEVLSKTAFYLAIIIFVLNLIIWPFIVNYLYYLRGRRCIHYLMSTAPAYTLENDVTEVGGTSLAAALAGFAFSIVFSLFLWASIASIVGKNKTIALPSKAEIEQIRLKPKTLSKDAVNLMIKQTKLKLRSARDAVTTWLDKNPDKTLADVDFQRIITELGLDDHHFKDRWGNEMHMIPIRSGFKIISAGPDKLLETSDDLSYQKILQNR